MNTTSSNFTNALSSSLLQSGEFADKIIHLESKVTKLSSICNDLNPYEPINDELKKRLKEFNIHEFEDPFKITNALLILLEDTIDELHIYKPVDPKEIYR